MQNEFENSRDDAYADSVKENRMRIFTGLDARWEKDNGYRFLEEFFMIFCEQVRLYRQWRRVKYEGAEVPALKAFDVEVLRLRLVPDEEDPRHYFGEGVDELLDELTMQTLAGPVYLSRENYLNVMEILLSCKETDEVNCRIMNERLTEFLLE